MRGEFFGLWFCLWLLQMALPARAQIVTDQTALGFFTNVASRLLTSQLNVNLHEIQIYPTNHYTPAVHRLLQVAANVYDATTTNFYPSVFRPVFRKDWNGSVFIIGYTYLDSISGPTDLRLSTPFDITTIAAMSGGFDELPGNDNIYGIPWIIGAKKGFPNFNEFSVENTLSVTRRLQFTRITNGSPSIPPLITGTNQMYLMILNSSIGVELWNSYASNYTGSILIGVSDTATIAITNDDHGANLLFLKTVTTNVLISVNAWPGSGTAPWRAGNPFSASFVVNLFFGPGLTNSVYRSAFANGNPNYTLGFIAPGFITTNYFNPNYFGSAPLLFETNSPNGFYLPQFGVLMTNRLQVFLLDFTNGVYHVIDYVHFAGPNSGFNVNSNLAEGYPVGSPYFEQGVWDTNFPSGFTGPYGPTYGILNQIAACKNGVVPTVDGLWKSDPAALPPGGTLAQQAAFFRAFFLPGNRTFTPVPTTNLLLTMVAPYAPTRNIVQYYTWQANDPLVHYLASDVDYSFSPNLATVPQPGVSHYNADQTLSALTSLNLGKLNDRYMPWSGNPHWTSEQLATSDTNRYNLAERDPLLTQSDNWNFPTALLSDLTQLGQVHRGTPWQTLYLKSSPMDLSAWQFWTGDFARTSAQSTLPTNDWLVVSQLITLFNTNDFTTLMSVNNPDSQAWQNLFDGLTAWTNTDGGLLPLMIASNSPQAAMMATAIESRRANQIAFHEIGDVLATPELSIESPFLNWENADQLEMGITDAAYEMIPSHILPRLRTDSIGALTMNNGTLVIQFTGYEGHAYMVESSSDLVNWQNVRTNFPVNGTFTMTNSAPPNTAQFFRSRLIN